MDTATSTPGRRAAPRPPPPAGRDRTVELLRHGYRFVGRRADDLGADVFLTRLLFEPTICMRGPEAGALLLDEARFTREGAAPSRLVATLLGEGGVQGLDGDAHRHRKRLFLGLASRAHVDALVGVAREEWLAAVDRTPPGARVVVLDLAMEVLTRAVCRWAGVPLPDAYVARRTRDFAAMIDGGGGVGPRYLRGVLGRRRAEAWATGIVGRARAGTLAITPGSALARVSAHTDPDGAPLDLHAAAVELLNVLRPTVAVARWIVFALDALRDPAHRAFAARGPGERFAFVQEVRRFYPFFPFVAARVRTAFEWRGVRFEPGVRVLFDLYGTDHHPTYWNEPERFRPERFLGATPDPVTFVPQGPGDVDRDHRCPGEPAAVALTAQAVELLLGEVTYELPPQDWSIDLARVPTFPRDRGLVTGLRRRA